MEQDLEMMLQGFEDGKSILARFNRENSYLPRGLIGRVILFMDITPFEEIDLDRETGELYPPFRDSPYNGPAYHVTIKWPEIGQEKFYIEYSLRDEEIELFEETAYSNPDQFPLFQTIK